jgi:hypothetical protein
LGGNENTPHTWQTVEKEYKNGFSTDQKAGQSHVEHNGNGKAVARECTDTKGGFEPRARSHPMTCEVMPSTHRVLPSTLSATIAGKHA